MKDSTCSRRIDSTALGHASTDEEVRELLGGLGVGLDGPRRTARRSERSLPGRKQGGDVDRRQRGRPRRRLLHNVMEDALGSQSSAGPFECATKVICRPIVVIRSRVAHYCRCQLIDAVVELRVARAFEPMELADLASEHDELPPFGRILHRTTLHAVQPGVRQPSKTFPLLVGPAGFEPATS
jgi:hypothetical protein